MSTAASVGPATEKDEFLISCVSNALASAAQLRPHGTVRFRLEKLLETSPDILRRFQEKSSGSSKPADADETGNSENLLDDPNLIFVEDNLLLEVCESKPRKPERWQIPSDLSLKTYLEKKTNPSPIGTGTMGSTRKSKLESSMGSAATTGTMSGFKKERPKFERFNVAETRLEIRAQLHRPHLAFKDILETETLGHKTLFKDPQAPPPVPMLHPVERKELEEIRKKDALMDTTRKKKMTVTLSSDRNVEIQTPPKETQQENEEFEKNVDGLLVSEVSPQEVNKEQPKSPKSSNASPRPRSAIKGTESQHDLEKTQTELASCGDVDVYDRELALEHLLAVTPYTRMVFIFKYDNDRMLEALNAAVNAVNQRALPNIQGTVRSYSLTPEEEEATNAGELDLVCGFTIIDDDTRMVVLEGLAGYDKGMESIFIDMPRYDINNEEVKILSNPEVLFPRRLYTEYGPDVKRIRPRDKLAKLIKKPELYDRKQVDEVCFEALEKIMDLRRAMELQPTKDFEMYPSTPSLNKMELLYGEAISKEDLDGSRAVKAKKALKMKKAGGIDNSTLTASYGSETDAASNKNMVGAVVGEGSPQRGEVSIMGNSTFKRGVSRLAETDCWNDAFVERLARREVSGTKCDYIVEQRELRKAAWRQGLQRRANRNVEDKETLARLASKNPELSSGLLHGYAGNSVNIKEMLLADTRDRFKNDREASYTYSRDFQSQTLVLVDEYADRLKIQAANKAKNISKKGFIYPAPKTREELLSHPKKPSSIRIEELHTPFPGEEMEFIDSSGSTMLPEIREKNAKLKDLERNFDNKLSGNKLFGMLKPPEYERDFELSAIGDRSKLPRGHLTGGTEPRSDFWRSVHASGDEGIKLQEKIQQEEKDLWKSKVVVDTLDFKVGNFKVKDKAAQWQRHEDMLKDAPKTKAFKHLRTMKNYETLPIAVMTQGEYVQNASEKALVRAENKDCFITTKEMLPGTAGQPKDFVRYINKHVDKPKIQTKVHKIKHPPISAAITTGSKWGEHIRSDNK